MTVICIFMILFPAAFFVSDGYRGGMPVFFVFAVTISVFMLRGRLACIVTGLELALYVGISVFAYLYPTYIRHFDSEIGRLQDVVLSFVTVSIALGIIMHYHIRLNYEQQRELERAREEALALSKVKTTFLTNMSHEIRTPINVILGMNEMILRESTSDQIRRYASNIQIAGKTLLSLINNILDLAKIESGKLELMEENYKTVDLIFDLVVIGRESAARKGLVFQTQVDRNLPSAFYGDSLHIKRVVVNFLSNAVKYTNEGFVTLGVSCKEVEGQTVLCISVQDTGIGIDPGDLDRLFESFTRAEAAAQRAIEGSGLGLAIARELTELMGGKIYVESKVGYGSTFTVEIPQDVVDPTPLGQWESQQAAVTLERTSFVAPAAKVLIVDDNKENLEVTDSPERKPDAGGHRPQRPAVPGPRGAPQLRSDPHGLHDAGAGRTGDFTASAAAGDRHARGRGDRQYPARDQRDANGGGICGLFDQALDLEPAAAGAAAAAAQGGGGGQAQAHHGRCPNRGGTPPDAPALWCLRNGGVEIRQW